MIKIISIYFLAEIRKSECQVADQVEEHLATKTHNSSPRTTGTMVCVPVRPLGPGGPSSPGGPSQPFSPGNPGIPEMGRQGDRQTERQTYIRFDFRENLQTRRTRKLHVTLFHVDLLSMVISTLTSEQLEGEWPPFSHGAVGNQTVNHRCKFAVCIFTAKSFYCLDCLSIMYYNEYIIK